jgi:hypothetical protein
MGVFFLSAYKFDLRYVQMTTCRVGAPTSVRSVAAEVLSQRLRFPTTICRTHSWREMPVYERLKYGHDRQELAPTHYLIPILDALLAYRRLLYVLLSRRRGGAHRHIELS